jgi:hypothetical protein
MLCYVESQCIVWLPATEKEATCAAVNEMNPRTYEDSSEQGSGHESIYKSPYENWKDYLLNHRQKKDRVHRGHILPVANQYGLSAVNMSVSKSELNGRPILEMAIETRGHITNTTVLCYYSKLN